MNEDIAAHCLELENAIAQYIYEAHIKSLEGVNFCDHEVGVCFCSYFEALHKVIEVVSKSPFKDGSNKKYFSDGNASGKQKSMSFWTLELQAILTEHTWTKAQYTHLREILYELIHTDELSALISEGKTSWRDKNNFESILKSVSLHVKI